MPRVQLAYGETKIRADVPAANFAYAVEPNPTQPIELDRAFARGWAEPIGREAPDQVVRPGETLAILVPDHTRSVPTQALVSLLWERLRGRVRPQDVTVVVATGTHRAPTPEELARILGPFRELFTVVVHDAAQCAPLGCTSRGTPVTVNPAVLSADRVITLGHVAMHYFAGYAGGPKMVLPGVAGAETIRLNHEQILAPQATACVYEENPIHAEMREVARMAGVDLAVDVVLAGNGGALRVTVGDVVEAHRAAARFWDRTFQVPVPERVDVAIASPGGHPRDINLYQAHKAMFNAARIVRDGGMILLVAACPDGSGHPAFEDWAGRSHDLQGVLAIMNAEGFKIGGHKVYFLAKDRARGVEHFLVSRLPPTAARALWMNPVASVQEGLALARERYGPSFSVGVLPFGGETFPVVAAEGAGG